VTGSCYADRSRKYMFRRSFLTRASQHVTASRLLLSPNTHCFCGPVTASEVVKFNVSQVFVMGEPSLDRNGTIIRIESGTIMSYYQHRKSQPSQVMLCDIWRCPALPGYLQRLSSFGRLSAGSTKSAFQLSWSQERSSFHSLGSVHFLKAPSRPCTGRLHT
jgi:hypothetical protein